MQVLVIYYSQTGQLRSIINQVFSSVKNVTVDYCPIQPVTPFPFPWTASQFFDCMPECVMQVPESIEPLNIPSKNYDLIVLGYTRYLPY
jgi:hypothetical protein